MNDVYLVGAGAILVVLGDEKKHWTFWLGWFYVILGTIFVIAN